MSCNTNSTWRQRSHDHNWANGFSLSLFHYRIVGDCPPCSDVWFQAMVFGRNQWFFRTLDGAHNWHWCIFLSLQSTYGQSFAFPYKKKLENALLHSRPGCLQIETLSSAALLPVTLNTVDDKSILICTVVSIYNGRYTETFFFSFFSYSYFFPSLFWFLVCLSRHL